MAAEGETQAEWEGLDKTASLKYLEKDDIDEYPKALESVIDSGTNISVRNYVLIC